MISNETNKTRRRHAPSSHAQNFSQLDVPPLHVEHPQCRSNWRTAAKSSKRRS